MSCHSSGDSLFHNKLDVVTSQVKTRLENPTRYFIAQKQKRQLKEYLKTQGSPSAAGDLATVVSSASQPTLNAINQQAVAALTSSHLMGQPESPMVITSLDGNNVPDVSVVLYSLIPFFGDLRFLSRESFIHQHLRVIITVKALLATTLVSDQL